MAMAHMMHLAFPRCCGAPLEPSGNCSFHSYPAGTAVGAAAPGASCVPFVNAAASPSCMARRVWMRGTTRTRQRVIPRGCMCATANPLVPTGWTSLVSLEADRGDGLQVIPYGVGCVPWGVIAGPLVQDSRVCGCQVSAARVYVLYIPGAWVRGLPRTCQRDGVHVIPCGVGCRLYLAGSPGPRIRKAPMEEGVAALSARFQSRCSCWHARAP